MTAIVGIDLSTTGLALVAIPSVWTPGDWTAIRRRSLGTGPGASHTARRAALADDVVSWIEWVRGEFGPCEVAHEGYPKGGRVYNLDLLCELGGVVKHELREKLGIECEAAPLVSARKTLLGWVPKGAKEIVARLLREAGAGFADGDQADAFAVANHARSMRGLPFCTGMLGPKPEARKKSRRSRTQVEELFR